MRNSWGLAALFFVVVHPFPARAEAKSRQGTASQSKTETERAFERKLDGLEGKLSGLKGKVAQTGEQARSALETKIALLEDKQAHAKSKLGALQAASQKTWQKLRRSVDKAVRDFEHAFDDAP
jgi:hypothetical protein